MRDAGKVPEAGERRWLTWLLFSLAVALYARSLASGLVYDAVSQILIDPFIHQPRNLIPVVTLRVLGMDVIDFNRPVHLASLMLDALIWGQRPFGYHLTSILLHAGTVALLFEVLRRWLAAAWPAALAALLFAAHPVLTEAVGEPSYREDLLSGFFVMGALWLAGDWGATSGRSDRLRAAGLVVLCVLAVGSKENGVVVIPALLAWWWGRRRDLPRRPWLLLIGACALAAGALLAARFILEPATSSIFLERPARLGGSLAGSLPIIIRIWTLYLGHLVWPVNLSADYTGASISGIPAWLAVLLVSAVIAGQVLAARRSPLVALGAVLFWGALLPASNLLPMYRPAADRYLYVPMLGVAVMAAALLGWAWRQARWRRPVGALSLAVIAVLATATFRRQAVFASELALWTDTTRVEPSSVTAQGNLGWALLESGRPAEALPAFQRAVELGGGRSGDPYAGAALALVAMGQPDRALAAMRRAVTVEPIYGDLSALERTRRLAPHQLARLRPLLERLREK